MPSARKADLFQQNIQSCLTWERPVSLPATAAPLPGPRLENLKGDRSQFSSTGRVLLFSLEVLATDSGGNTYVALESTTGSREADEINVNKYVRKYSADGKLVDEIADIALDYYVTPVDELRVRRGVVYQLLTTNTEVRINVWDMK